MIFNLILVKQTNKVVFANLHSVTRDSSTCTVDYCDSPSSPSRIFFSSALNRAKVTPPLNNTNSSATKDIGDGTSEGGGNFA
jgi:hypothetical protein